MRLVLPPDGRWNTLVWLGFAADGSVLAHGESALAELPVAGELEILLPARRIAMHELTLPAQAGKHLDALIVQALEDRLLGDKADALAFPGPHQGTQRRVWVCSRRWLEAGLERLVAAGRHPSRLVPEYELLPEGAEATVTAATASGTLFRTVGGQFGLVDDEATILALNGWRRAAACPGSGSPARSGGLSDSTAEVPGALRPKRIQRPPVAPVIGPGADYPEKPSD